MLTQCEYCVLYKAKISPCLCVPCWFLQHQSEPSFPADQKYRVLFWDNDQLILRKIMQSCCMTVIRQSHNQSCLRSVLGLCRMMQHHKSSTATHLMDWCLKSSSMWRHRLCASDLRCTSAPQGERQLCCDRPWTMETSCWVVCFHCPRNRKINHEWAIFHGCVAGAFRALWVM